MTLPHDYKDINHRLYSTLNEDVHLKSDEYGRWDLDFKNGDIVYIDGLKSLENACVIAIMTRYNELSHNPLYKDFGCRVHELIKENQSLMVQYKIKEFIQDTLKNMRRIKKINWIEVTQSSQSSHKYDVAFSITSIDNTSTITTLSL